MPPKARDAAIRYKPLKGHYLISFILLETFEQVVQTVEQSIPTAHWSNIQLWRSETIQDHREQHWIQLQPPIRLDCQQLKGQAFIARGSHFQAGEIIELASAKSSNIVTEQSSPSLVWLEFGEIKTQAVADLKAVSGHMLLTPIQPKVLSLWEPNNLAEKASAIHDQVYASQDAHSTLALEPLKTNHGSEFVQAIAKGTDMPKVDAPQRPGKSLLWQQLKTLFRGRRTHSAGVTKQGTAAQNHRNKSRDHGARKQSFWSTLFSVFGVRSGSQPSGKKKGATSAGSNPSQQPSSQQPLSQRKQRPPNPLWQKLNAYWRERVMRSQLGNVIGKRQAAYFHHMMEQFNKGDLTEALKMAVPLSDYRQALDQTLSQRSLPNLGLPGKRANLDISTRKASQSRTYSFAQDSYRQLRSVYEKAYQQLKQSGQHKEAAFVLAELLSRVDEAVDYLVEQGFVTEAAEIAENRIYHVEKIIKLWIQAGNLERASNLAIRTNRFKAALMLMNGSKEAQRLETLWVSRLVSSGDFSTLFNYYADSAHFTKNYALQFKVLTDFFQNILPETYLEKPEWLARYLCVMPWQTVETQLLNLLKTPWSSEFELFWTTFSSLINRHGTWKSTLKDRVHPPLIKEWYRQVMTYHGFPSATISSRQLSFLSGYISDRLFLHSRPQTFHNPLVAIPTRKTTPSPTAFQFHPSETLITDVAVTTNGNICIAMGALGMRIYNVKGRCLKQLTTPAHKLVSPSPGHTAGEIVLAIEHREKLHRIHRVQLHTQTAHFMGQQPVEAYSRCHNSSTWAVNIGNRVSLIDILAAEWTRVWTTNNLEGTVRQIVSSNQQLTFLLDDDGNISPWQYKLPQLRLTSRSPISNITTPERLSQLALIANGEICGQQPIINAMQDTVGIQLYHSSSLKSYKPICKIERDAQQTGPWTNNTIKVIYSNHHIMLVTIEQSAQQQLIQAYKIGIKQPEIIFTVQSPIQPTAIQVIHPWIVIGQGDQVLTYRVDTEQSCLLSIS